MERKWIGALFVVIGIVLMASYDIDQNYKNLGSLTGGMAFTYCGSLFGFFVSRYPVSVVGAVLCVVISANMNVSNKLTPNAAQEALREREKALRSELYTEQQIMDCYNDIPQPCRSNVLIEKNERINNELTVVLSKIDTNLVIMTDSDKKWAIAQAVTVPFSLSLLTVLLGSIFQRDGIKKPKKSLETNLKGFKSRFKKFETGLKDFEIKKMPFSSAQNHALQKLYEDMCEEAGRVITKHALREEIRRQAKTNPGLEGLSCNNKIRWFWDNTRPQVIFDKTKSVSIQTRQRPDSVENVH